MRIAGIKTSAGDRSVPLLPALRDALLAHRADFPFGPKEPVFATRNGRRNTPNNVRKTVLNPAVERANELLEADGREPIVHLTPHSLRRTFTSILAVCEISQRRAVALVGHRDYELTAKVYQQDIDLSDESIDALERVIGCSLYEAYELLGGRLGRARRARVSVPNLHPGSTVRVLTSRVKRRCFQGLRARRPCAVVCLESAFWPRVAARRLCGGSQRGEGGRRL